MYKFTVFPSETFFRPSGPVVSVPSYLPVSTTKVTPGTSSTSQGLVELTCEMLL